MTFLPRLFRVVIQMSDDKHTTMIGSILYLNKSESGFSYISIRFVLIISTICIFSSGRNHHLARFVGIYA